MRFTSGQTIAHPVHGPMTVRELKSRTVRGVVTDYLELEGVSAGLRISVPVHNADEVGLRALMTSEQIEELLRIIRMPAGPVEKQWSRRIKAYHERLALGTPDAKATVFRDIVRSSGAEPHAGAERDILREVRASLGAELALSLGIDEETARGMLDEAAHAEDAVVSG
jgi:CarD family transcriptional regulator